MMPNKEPSIRTREELQLEQRRLKLVIKEQEAALRERVQKLPGELVYASVDSILPAALTGKVSDKILTVGKNFINNSIVKKTGGHTSRLVTAAKQAGIFTALRLAYKIFIKKK
ncbi:MAG: hypothetical protein ABUT20_42100 [Bacteroidota bacterium]